MSVCCAPWPTRAHSYNLRACILLGLWHIKPVAAMRHVNQEIVVKKFTVYERQWGRTDSKGFTPATMVPLMTINAKSAEVALIIAKRKGVLNPIIGEAA